VRWVTPGESRWYRGSYVLFVLLAGEKAFFIIQKRFICIAEENMSLSKQYEPGLVEPKLQSFWEAEGFYRFSRESKNEIFSIDTPPPTVSGNLHLGHIYSYSQTDFLARYRRMRGDTVFYPMGYDDNGLPTDRLVEKRFGIRAFDTDREDFIAKCLQVSEESEAEYQALWKRVGLSVDWRYTYRTIDEHSSRIAQYSFLDLFKKGLVYRRDAPTIWCPECQTAIAQADLDDLERGSEFVTLSFKLAGEGTLPIATTRPELLPACVAIFVQTSDQRYQHLIGSTAVVPLFGRTVPILADPAVDAEKGTGAVMCCTFGDVTDVSWWYTHNLPLVELISTSGNLTEQAGEFAGLSISVARKKIIDALETGHHILSRYPTTQSIRVHERCDTPAEYIVTPQWFIQLLSQKESLLEAGEKVCWHPPHMKSRYRAWVENLKWDWCISRQRYFGVQFPVWYCKVCKEIKLADESQLPVDPLKDSPLGDCSHCGSKEFIPETDVFDTWMTSSMTPQIAGGWQDDPHLYQVVYPFSMRPQAHEIIRTWAFYTIYKSKNHFDKIPWENVTISGWGISGEGMGKVSKSRGGGPMPPLEMIELYSADAVRYWASSTGLGKDSIISEEKIQVGNRLVTKLWNVARFSERFLTDYTLQVLIPPLTPADQWILSRLQRLIERVTQSYDRYEYATSKSEVEAYFWTEFADNYLEMCKQRLYESGGSGYESARYTIYHVLLSVLKMFAPILPFVTDEIFQIIFSPLEGDRSIHCSAWPTPNKDLISEEADEAGTILVEIATFVRRYKSERNLPLGTKITKMLLATEKNKIAEALRLASADLISITRSEKLEVLDKVPPDVHLQQLESGVFVYIER
jgi:valyl-tRNA synthetase